MNLGRVVVELEIENFADYQAEQDGRLAADAIRRVTCEALVDSGATFLSLPESIVRSLGLKAFRKRRVRTANGTVERTIYDPVIVRVQGRDCIVPIIELPDDCEPLLGQVPLEMMDWWIDPVNQRLVGNPRHGGDWQLEA
jgi:clan AA aspartic protease